MKSIALLLVILAVSASRHAPPEGHVFSWKVSFPVEEDEEGERMIVRGTVYDKDGKTPLEGIVVYAYHTDAHGHYSYDGSGNRNPRLEGWMRTKRDGKYEFESIRPASYPESTVPAHVHYVVALPDETEQSFELVFEDDPLVSDRIRRNATPGAFWIVRPIERDKKGTWHCTADLVLFRR